MPGGREDPRANDLRVRPAAEADLATLVRLRDDAARWMPALGITGQWQPGEPDCLAGDARLNAYYQDAGYRVVGRREGKPQPSGTPKSLTLLEKELQGPGTPSGRLR